MAAESEPMSSVTIAPHLQRALDSMSRDLGIEPHALINQAVFAWLRINGYVGAPAAAPVVSGPTPAPQPAPVEAPAPHVATAPAPVAASVPRVAPSSAPVALGDEALPREANEPMPDEAFAPDESPSPEAPPATPHEPGDLPLAAPEPTSPEPAAESAPAPAAQPEPGPAPAALEAEAPQRDAKDPVPAALIARMDAIDADLQRLARVWPAWAREAEEEKEDEQDAAADDAEAAAASADDARAAADEHEGEEDDADDALKDEAEAAAAAEAEPAVDPLDAELPADDHVPSGPLNNPDDDMDYGATRVATAHRQVQVPGEDEKTILPGSMSALDLEAEPPADSTVVLRSSPFVLYLEREGDLPVKVDVERFVIGRGPQCDLIIDSPRVSREHLAITRMGARFLATDLNSSNGTWMNEERISERELEDGDVLHLGNEPVTFMLRAE